jgi:hypothetical protein
MLENLVERRPVVVQHDNATEPYLSLGRRGASGTRTSPTAQAGNTQFWLLSTLRAHTNALVQN